MKLTVNNWLRSGWMRPATRVAVCVLTMWLVGMASGPAQAVSTTTVQGTVYLANGQPAGGTLVVSWPTFTTAAGQLVASGSTTVMVGADGFVSVNLAPNQGATPAGEYYTAVFYKSDGAVSRQYWLVPAAAQATLAQVQAQVMPAAQAVQAVNKAYVDQAVSQALSSQITATGGNLTGPLYLSGDPTQPLQAADKHYVDSSFSAALPLAGGAATGPLTATRLGGALQVDQFPGADFGAKLQACLNAVNPTYGGTCDARNFTGSQSMGSNLTVSTANTTVELPCATIATASQVIVTAGTRNVSLRGCALRGGSAANGNLGGTVFEYSGTGPMVQVGDPAYLADTPGFHLDDVDINTTGATSASAEGLAAFRTQEMDVESVYFLGNANQTGMTLDGTGNYTGGTFFDDAFNGFGTAVNAIGHQAANAATTDWLNASTFVRLHIDCPLSGGNPIAGTVGINLRQGDGNTFTGGDVEGCGTALYLGPNAQNNTIIGLRNENSTNQVVADAGSAYNNWITGGTMFTGKLTDNGTRNSFLDTFHRSFNGMNGDWYGSQQDATVTNHYRLGTGMGNERGLLKRYQTDYGYRWTTGLTDGTAGEQFYQITDELNNLNRISVGQYLTATANSVTNVVMNSGGCYSSNTAPAVSFSGGGGSGAAGTANMVTSSCSGGWTVGSVTMTSGGSGYTSQPAMAWSGGSQVSAPSAVAEISTAGSSNDQTVLNAAGTGAVVLNGSNNAGTGGVVFGSGGPSETTVATINNAGNAQFNGTLQVGGSSSFNGSTTVRNQADAEIDSILQAGASVSQKESFLYRDWNGASQWYMVKDQNNNWALNSATGNLDSFKAYQSTNSGDTYIDAIKPSGVVRVNYETGAGTAFNIYGGGSSSLYASFGAANAIKFPGLAASSGDNCLQIDNSGYISNTGSPCGSGGVSGTVGSGNTGQIAYYTANGTTLGGMSTVPVTAGGTGATTSAAALQNLLPGVSADGSNGVVITGNSTVAGSHTKNAPITDASAYPGWAVDNITDITPALQAAINSGVFNGAGASPAILLPCAYPGYSKACYFASPESITAGPNGMPARWEVQGHISVGQTWVLPGDLEGIGGGIATQFQHGPVASIDGGKLARGTLGSALTTTQQDFAFTPSFTSGSIANLPPGSAITIAGTTTVSNVSAARTVPVSGTNLVTLTMPSAAVTFNGTVSIAGTNSWVAGQEVEFAFSGNYSTTGPKPGTVYYVLSTGLSGSSFEIASSPGGTAITANAPASGSATAWARMRTPPGVSITISGCSDSSFNLNMGITGASDYSNHQLTTYDNVGTPGSTTGCTVTALDMDKTESDRVLCSNGVTLGGYSSYTCGAGQIAIDNKHYHDATDQWGEVVIASTINNANPLMLKNISVSNCPGACIWIEGSNLGTELDNVGATPQNGDMAGEALDLSRVEWLKVHRSSFIAAQFPGNSPSCPGGNCTQTNIPYSVICDADAPGLYYFSNQMGCHQSTFDLGTVIDGGVYIGDSAGSQSNITLPRFDDVTFERITANAITIDNRGGVNYAGCLSLNRPYIQDFGPGGPLFDVDYTNYGAPSGCVSYSDPYTVDTNNFFGPHFNGIPFGAKGQNSTTFPQPTYASAPNGVFQDGGAIESEVRGGEAGNGMDYFPFGTLAANTSPSSWSTGCGSNCSVTNVVGPFGPSDSTGAAELDQNGNGEQTITVGTWTGSTYAGDMFLYRVWVRPGANNAYSEGSGLGGAHLLGGAFNLNGNGEVFAYANQLNPSYAYPGAFGTSMSHNGWYPEVAIAYVQTGNSTSHNVNFRLDTGYTGSGFGSGNQFFQPCWAFIPGPNNPAYAGVTMDEVMEARQDMYHGDCPPNMPAGTSATSEPVIAQSFGNPSATIIPATATLPYVGFKTFSGTGTPSDTCSATANAGVIEINAAPNSYQCSNATGAYQWNALGGSGGGSGGITSLNGLSGPVTIAGGAGTSVTASGSTVTIAHLPGVVAAVPPTTISGGAGGGTLYTPGAAGEFRACYYLDVTVAATAGYFTPTLKFTSDGHSFTVNLYTNLGASTQWNVAQGCYTFYSDAAAISWGINTSSLSGSPTERYALSLEQLQ